MTTAGRIYNNSLIGSPSVRIGTGRPVLSKKWCSVFTPNRWYTVDSRQLLFITRLTGSSPRELVAPMTCPIFSPPPERKMLIDRAQWSRPGRLVALSWCRIFGVRPNSPQKMNRTFSFRPRS